MLHIVAGGDPAVLSGGFDSENISLALDLSPDAGSSRLLGADSAPPSVVKILAGENVTLNNHKMGVTPDAFAGNSNLTSTLSILSTNRDRRVCDRPFGDASPTAMGCLVIAVIVRLLMRSLPPSARQTRWCHAAHRLRKHGSRPVARPALRRRANMWHVRRPRAPCLPPVVMCLCACA